MTEYQKFLRRMRVGTGRRAAGYKDFLESVAGRAVTKRLRETEDEERPEDGAVELMDDEDESGSIGEPVPADDTMPAEEPAGDDSASDLSDMLYAALRAAVSAKQKDMAGKIMDLLRKVSMGDLSEARRWRAARGRL